jgi:hypothetical protein
MSDDAEAVRVMIRCHTTGRAVATGVETVPRAWRDRPLGINKVSCPACNGIHAWSKSDAYLEGSFGFQQEPG